MLDYTSIMQLHIISLSDRTYSKYLSVKGGQGEVGEEQEGG